MVSSRERAGALPLAAALCLGSLVFFKGTLAAETFSYGADAGVGETDNVTLAHTDKVSQTMAVTDVDFDFQRQSSRLDVDAKGDFTYLDYLQNAYHNELLGRFDGNGTFALVPQRLTWNLQDDYGQMAIDPFTPTTPTNLETVNYVSTGPDLTLRPSGATFVDLSARVARADYETSTFTNNRLLASVAWGLKLSALSSVSLSSDTQRVLFENTMLNTDFDRTNVFVRYTLQGSRTDLLADVGATEFSQSGGSTTGSLAKLSLSRRLSAAAKLILAVGHDVTDGGTSFSALQTGTTGVGGTAPAAAAVTSQNYTSNFASATWSYTRNLTSLSVSGRWEKDTYDGMSDLDHTLRGGDVRLQRTLARAFAVQITGRILQSDYFHSTPVVGSPDNETTSFGGAVTWRHGRGLELKVAAEHTRYITSPNDIGYRESRVFITVGYRPNKLTSQSGNTLGD